jgi:hypothetical protein
MNIIKMPLLSDIPISFCSPDRPKFELIVERFKINKRFRQLILMMTENYFITLNKNALIESE